MESPTWDPYGTLNIIGKDDQDMACVGREVSRWNARCSFRLPSDVVTEIHKHLREMANEPPEDAGPRLRQLAHLSLCEEDHQDQKLEIIAQWKKLVAGVNQDNDATQQLLSENARLVEYLEEERRERVRLQAVLSKRDELDSAPSEVSDDSDSHIGELARELEDMKAKLTSALREANRHEKNFQVAEATRKTLAARTEYLEAMYAKRDREADNLKQLLEEQKVDFVILLEDERQAALKARVELQAHQEQVQRTGDGQAAIIERLQADLRDKSRMLDQRLIEVKEKTGLCAVLARKIEDSDDLLSAQREATEELKKDIEESASTQLNLAATIANLEAQLASEQERAAKLQSDVTAAQEAETSAAEKLESFRAQFLEEQQVLQVELDRAVKRRTELLEEVESMRSSARRSTMKIEEDLAAVIREQETLEEEMSTLQSQLSSERHSSIRETRDLEEETRNLEEAKAAQSVLVEEIELLRSQLESEREGRSELETEITNIKIEKYKLGVELQEQKEATEKQREATEQQKEATEKQKAATEKQREAAEKQKEVAEKLDLLLTAAKEQETYLTVQLTCVQASLRHAQLEQDRSLARVEALIALRPLHIKFFDMIKGCASPRRPDDQENGQSGTTADRY